MSSEARLRRVFADVFAIDPDGLGDDDSPETIDAWDSVAHLNLILGLEGEFGVRFDAEEIPDLTSFRVIRCRVLSGVRDDR